jgi:hypothetical protein
MFLPVVLINRGLVGFFNRWHRQAGMEHHNRDMAGPQHFFRDATQQSMTNSATGVSSHNHQAGFNLPGI